MNYKLVFLFVFLSAVITYPQQFTNWKNYTDMKEVRNVHAFSNGVWAATGGGAFLYSGSSNSFTALNKAEGLQGIFLTTVSVDKSGKVWFGSANGIIDIFNPDENSFRVILDIFNSNHINKSINDLILSGDTIIVSSDFGVSLIDTDNLLFFDTFFKFGDFPTNTKVNNTVKIDLIYICTDEGVAIQKQNAVNLSAPESWNVYNEDDGLPSNTPAFEKSACPRNESNSISAESFIAASEAERSSAPFPSKAPIRLAAIDTLRVVE